MTKDVLVSVKGTQIVDEERDTIEIITAGSYYEKGGQYYIFYDESVEGLEEPTRNRVKASADLVEVNKRGAVESVMTFECGKKHLSNYLTPLGLVVLGLTTSVLRVEEKENEICIHLEYALEMNGDYISTCEMDISARSKKQEA